MQMHLRLLTQLPAQLSPSNSSDLVHYQYLKVFGKSPEVLRTIYDVTVAI